MPKFAMRARRYDDIPNGDRPFFGNVFEKPASEIFSEFAEGLRPRNLTRRTKCVQHMKSSLDLLVVRKRVVKPDFARP